MVAVAPDTLASSASASPLLPVEDVSSGAASAIARSHWGGVARRLARDPVAVCSALVLLAIVGSALLAPWIVPDDPYRTSMLQRLMPIGTQGHLLGTDELGRDMIARLLFGGRLSLLLGVMPVVFAFVIGATVGLFAGYVGGWVEHDHHADARRVLRVPVRAARGRRRRRARSRHEQQHHRADARLRPAGRCGSPRA